ncbi:MAG: hypothetical protein M1826_004023, partial [Phylliscum demangeonii]
TLNQSAAAETRSAPSALRCDRDRQERISTPRKPDAADGAGRPRLPQVRAGDAPRSAETPPEAAI